MTAAPLEPSPLGSPISKRILLFVGGVLILGLGGLITLGAALIGVVSIAIVWFVQRRKGKWLTRAGAWFASVIGTMIPLLVVMVIGFLSTPLPTPTAAERKARMEEVQRRRDSLPDFLKKIMSAQQQGNSAARTDSLAEQLLQNKPFMTWFAGIAAMIGSAMIGLFAGSLGWAGSMLVYRGARDMWMGAEVVPGPAVD
jgi:hypothetical protein